MDAGAVALAEINLLLSVLTHTTGKRVLSDCAPISTANLRVGNSLISGSTGEQRRSAFASQHQQQANPARDQALTRSTTRELAAKKDQLDSENWQPFNWEIEFPEVFDPDLPDGERGFTVVVGNPPYLFGEHIPADEKPYLESQYEMARGQYDLYWLFYERSIDLLKEGGLHGFVVPDALTVRDEVRRVREMLVNRGQLKDIARVGAAFPAPEVSTVVTVWQKSKERSASVNIDLIDSAGLSSVDRIKVQTLAAPPSYRFSILVPNELQAIFARMMGRSNPLSDHVSISRGEELGKRELHRLDAEISKGHLPILVGKDVGSFEPCRARHSIEEDRIRKNRSLYGQTKIVVVKTGYKLKATLDTSGFCTLQSLYNLIPRQSNIDLRPLLAIMLSTPVQEYLWRTFTGYKSVFPQINQSQLGQLPIPWLDINSADPVPVHEALIRLSQRMLDLSETRLAVLTAVAGVLGTGSDTSSSLRSYIDQLDGLIDFQPLLDSSLEGQVDGVTVDERADSILVRVRIGPSDGATLDMGRIGSGDEWHDAARLTAVDRELHLYILVALKGYLAEKHRKRVWSRGKVLDGVLQAVKIPQPPAAAVPELLAGLRLALPADLHHHSAGLDEDGAPLHLTSIEDDLRATRSEIDRYVYSLFGLGTDEQVLLDTFRCTKV